MAERKQFEVFDKLRDFGRSLDKMSINLKNKESSDITSNARASLNLKNLLVDAKNFKEEASKQISEAKSRGQDFASQLAYCQEQAGKIRNNIVNLENHLTKYGYKKPAEELLEIPVYSTEEANEDKPSDQCNSADTQRRSPNDKETCLERPEQKEIVENKEIPSEEQTKPAEIDWRASPVRPVIFTKFLDIESDEEDHTHTKLLDSEDYLKSPTLQTIQTPMIKAAMNINPLETDNKNDSVLINSPVMPIFQTPGLGVKTTGAQNRLADLKTPSPPVIQSCKLLTLEDLNSDEDVSEITTQTKSMYHFPDVDEEIYQGLLHSIKKQFTMKQMNILIGLTAEYLNERPQENHIITDEELLSVLQLGPYTQAFALAMIKLQYFTLKKSVKQSTLSRRINNKWELKNKINKKLCENITSTGQSVGGVFHKISSFSNFHES